MGPWEATQAGPSASPAAACGVVGLKPTWGRVSRYGVLALAESLDHVGPLTRSSADAAVMLQAIAGHDQKDPTSLPDPVPDMVKNLNAGVKGVRVGFDEQGTGQHANAELAEAVASGVQPLGAAWCRSDRNSVSRSG